MFSSQLADGAANRTRAGDTLRVRGVSALCRRPAYFGAGRSGCDVNWILTCLRQRGVDHHESRRPGGTWFVGRGLAEAACHQGHEVVSFNRGQAAVPPAGVRVVRGGRTVAADLERLARYGPWDVVVDVHGVAPRHRLSRAGDRQLNCAARTLRAWSSLGRSVNR